MSVFRLFKKRVLPKEHRPQLAAHERVLAWAMTSSARPLVATNLGLWVGGQAVAGGADTAATTADEPAGTEARPPRPGMTAERTSWHEISKAVWDGSVLTVTTSTVVEHRDGYDVIADRAPDRYVLEDPGHLPHEVRLRVTSSVAHPAQFAHGWVAARRIPGRDGLYWVVRYDPGVDPAEHAAETDAFVKETCWKNVGGSE